MEAGELELASRTLGAWGLGEAAVRRIAVGLINRTYVVTREGTRHVLQWVNPIFAPSVEEDIDAVTTHLAASGLTTPRLIRTRDGALSVPDARAGHWRLMTYVDGSTYEKAGDAAQCRSAGRLVGRFHAAVSTLQWEFRHRRPHVHDTPRHLRHLAEVLEASGGHARFTEVAPIGREILARSSDLPRSPALPPRIVHGDLKISNVVFAHDGEALALVDLDTLARMSIPLELGDAWRSWCNPAGEDVPEAEVNLELLRAALAGYAEHGRALLHPSEIEALPTSIETIALELAARFCADALEESYFGWDRARYASAGEHNLVRARGQLGLARSLARERPRIEALVRETLG